MSSMHECFPADVGAILQRSLRTVLLPFLWRKARGETRLVLLASGRAGMLRTGAPAGVFGRKVFWSDRTCHRFSPRRPALRHSYRQVSGEQILDYQSPTTRPSEPSFDFGLSLTSTVR